MIRLQAPQIIVLVLIIIRLGVKLQQQREKFEPVKFIVFLLEHGTYLGLLYWGGFFTY